MSACILRTGVGGGELGVLYPVLILPLSVQAKVFIRMEREQEKATRGSTPSLPIKGEGTESKYKVMLLLRKESR